VASRCGGLGSFLEIVSDLGSWILELKPVGLASLRSLIPKLGGQKKSATRFARTRSFPFKSSTKASFWLDSNEKARHYVGAFLS